MRLAILLSIGVVAGCSHTPNDASGDTVRAALAAQIADPEAPHARSASTADGARVVTRINRYRQGETVDLDPVVTTDTAGGSGSRQGGLTN